MALDPAFSKLIPTTAEANLIPVKAIYDPSNNLMHFQSEPYFDTATGEIKVRRLGSYPVIVEQAFSYVEEYKTGALNGKEAKATADSN